MKGLVGTRNGALRPNNGVVAALKGQLEFTSGVWRASQPADQLAAHDRVLHDPKDVDDLFVQIVIDFDTASWLTQENTGSAAKALLWVVLIVAAAVVANVAGIYLLGSVAGWEAWLAATAGYFLVWRLCLYGATIYGWVWMRRRLLTREVDAQARRRLARTEIMGGVAIVALEASLLVQG